MAGKSPSLTDKDLLARLIAFDSTSANSNIPIADFICDYLDCPHVHIQRQVNDDQTKVNLIARIGPQSNEDRAGLILSGHMDVVPATEPQWNTNPFQLIEHDGAWFGRGTCDMKGFLALAMNVFRSIDPASLKAPLMLIFTCDEEVGSIGAKHLAHNWPSDSPLPKSALIGEPTSLRAVRMHKGHLTLRITTRGKSAHSGSPHLGINAIEPAADIINALINLRKEFESRRTPTSEFFPQVPFPVLNIARITGGEAINIIPDHCSIDVGVRLLPGDDSDLAIQQVRAAVGDTAELQVLNDNPPMLLDDENAPIHRALCQLISQTQSHGVSYASDAGWLSRIGINCVLYGPGTIEVAHRPNEFVPIEEFNRAKQTVQQLVHHMCVIPTE